MGRLNHFHVTAVAAVLAAALPAVVTADDWKLEAGMIAKETYSDNVGLSATNPKSDFITEFSPFISAAKKGARLEADFRYTMQNLVYADQSSRNRVNHQLAARSKAELWENELFLDANASISQQITSLLGPIGADTTTGTENLTNVYSVTVSPYWQHRFGTTANLLARYSHSEVDYGGNSFSSSSSDTINLGLASGSAFNDVFWALNYSDRQTNYDGRPDVGFTTTRATLGYALTPKWRVHGSIGYQDHSYAGATTALSGSIWDVGVAWAPTNRTNLSVGYGDNPFGKTHGFDFRHRTKYTNWTATYSEALSTGSGQFTNLETGTAFAIDPATGLILASPATNTQTLLTDSVFLNKRFNASVGHAKGRSTLSLSVYHTTQELQQSQSFTQTFGNSGIFLTSDTVKQRGANASWRWRLSPVLTSTLGFGIGHIMYVGNVNDGRRDTHSNVQAGLTRTFNPDLSGSVTLRHQERSSNRSGNDATETAITGSVRYKF